MNGLYYDCKQFISFSQSNVIFIWIIILNHTITHSVYQNEIKLILLSKCWFRFSWVICQEVWHQRTMKRIMNYTQLEFVECKWLLNVPFKLAYVELYSIICYTLNNKEHLKITSKLLNENTWWYLWKYSLFLELSLWRRKDTVFCHMTFRENYFLLNSTKLHFYCFFLSVLFQISDFLSWWWWWWWQHFFLQIKFHMNHGSFFLLF